MAGPGEVGIVCAQRAGWVHLSWELPPHPWWDPICSCLQHCWRCCCSQGDPCRHLIEEKTLSSDYWSSPGGGLVWKCLPVGVNQTKAQGILSHSCVWIVLVPKLHISLHQNVWSIHIDVPESATLKYSRAFRNSECSQSFASSSFLSEIASHFPNLSSKDEEAKQNISFPDPHEPH